MRKPTSLPALGGVLFVVIGVLLSPAPARADTELRVGLYQNQPKLFRDADGEPSGLLVDLLDAIAAEEDWSITYVDCQWQTCLRMLEDGRLDLMPDVALTPRRARRFAFHDVAVTDAFSRVYSKSGADIKTTDDLQGKRVAVLAGSSQQTAMRRLDTRLGGSLQIMRSNSFEDAFRLVARDKADAVVSNTFFGDRDAARLGLKRTPVVLQPAQLYFAAPKGTHGAELAAIDRHLDDWQQRTPSPYYDAMHRWTSTHEADRLPQWVWYALGGGVGILALSALLIAWLRREVDKRTRHLDEKNEELRRQQQHLSLMVDHGPDIVIHTDTDGRIVYVNPMVEALIGWSVDELLGKPAADIFGPFDDPDVSACLGGDADQPLVARLDIEHRDGHTLPVEVRAGGIKDEQGQPWLCQLIIRDLSKRMRALEILERTQRMETAGMLAGGIAHDVNNMIAVIQSNTQFALAQCGDDDLLREALEDTLEAAQTASNVTGQLLNFGKQRPAEPQLVSVSARIRQLSEMLERFIDERISLELELTDADDLALLNPVQLEQIVLNLSLNARDAIDGSGQIRISTHLDEASGEVVLQVTDDGSGMDQQTLDRVFEPFFTTKGQEQGTGLGMATVYGAVAQANGAIDITSNPGEGTCVTVRFPANQPPA